MDALLILKLLPSTNNERTGINRTTKLFTSLQLLCFLIPLVVTHTVAITYIFIAIKLTVLIPVLTAVITMLTVLITRLTVPTKNLYYSFTWVCSTIAHHLLTDEGLKRRTVVSDGRDASTK